MSQTATTTVQRVEGIELQETEAPPSAAEAITEKPRVQPFQFLSCFLCFLLAGLNDGCVGALIPHIRRHYDVSVGLVALIYIPTFLGWAVTAAINAHAHKYLGTGGTLTAGGILLLIANVIRAAAPPFPAFVFSFFLASLGIGLQDAQANTFIAGVELAHRWLGILHAMYGAGSLVAPLASTAIANAGHWNYYFIVVGALAAISSLIAAISLRSSKAESRSQPAAAMKVALRNKAVWLVSLFFTLYLGATITISGWVVEFLIEVRGGDLKKLGYVPTGFAGGLTLGRVVLPDVTMKFGERLSIAVFVFLCIVCELVFWLVPNVTVNAVAISVMGFFSGPCFVTGVNVTTKLLPKAIHVAGIGLIFVMGQLGAAVFPYVTGVLATKFGVEVLQPTAMGLLAATLVAWLLIPKVPTRAE